MTNEANTTAELRNHGLYTKLPVTIEAYHLPAAGEDVPDDFHEWCERVGLSNFLSDRDEGLLIHTLEGEMRADPGDWIIKGIKGEFYPCKPDVFAATYVEASRAKAAQAPVRDEIWTDIERSLRAVMDGGASAELDEVDCRRLLDLMAKVGLSAQAARFGVDHEHGPMLDAVDAAELAFDYAVQQHCVAVLNILDGKDTGAGANNEPWGSVRKRLLVLVRERDHALVAADAKARELDRVKAEQAVPEGMINALRPFAEIGSWLFARPQVPDDTIMVEVDHINGVRTGLTRGHFKAAHKALLAAAPSAPAAPATHPEKKLLKPARVGGFIFRVGVRESHVIEAAQRQFEMKGEGQAMTPEQRTEEERKRRAMWDMAHGPIESEDTHAAPQPAAPHTSRVDEIMAQAQVFASAHSLVGSRFDTGDELENAETQKAELRAMVSEALAAQPTGVPAQGDDLSCVKHLIEVVRMPNAEYEADAHNAAVRKLRAIAQAKESGS